MKPCSLLIRSTILLASAILAVFLGSAFQPVTAASVPSVNQDIFYFHHSNAPVLVGGILTSQLLNTTARFGYLTDQAAKQNSLYKPPGLQGLSADFFAYPYLAGPVTFNGTWTVQVWVNSSALSPASFNIRFRELSARGTVTWDTGRIAPLIASSKDSYVDAAVSSYSLSTPVPLIHTFAQSSSIEASVSIYLPLSTITIRLWNDSPLYPSRTVFPAVTQALTNNVWLEDPAGSVTTILPAIGQTVSINVEAKDPLGGYDINLTSPGSRDASITLYVASPNGIVLNGESMTITTGNYSTFDSSLHYDLFLKGTAGQYTAVVSLTDNSGNKDQRTMSFTLGPVHRLTTRIVDSRSNPLPGSVLSASTNGFQSFSGAANASGIVDGMVVGGNYTLKVSWEGVEVYQGLFSISSDALLTVNTQVYYPTFVVVDDKGQPLPKAPVTIAYPNGTLGPILTAGANGTVKLVRVPAGGFRLNVQWHAVTVYDGVFDVRSDGPYPVRSSVYQLATTIRDGQGTGVPGAYVVLYSLQDQIMGFNVTDSSGVAVFKVAAGTYKVEAFYSAVQQSGTIKTDVTQTQVLVDSSRSIEVSVDTGGPVSTSTSTFLILSMVLVAISAAAVTYFGVEKVPRWRASRKRCAE